MLRIYDLLEWCDACSPLLGQNLLQPEKRRLEISSGPGKKMYHLIQTEEEPLTVDPWASESEKFIIHFEWRLIKQLQFASSTEFRKAFLAAPIEETMLNLVRESVPKKENKV